MFKAISRRNSTGIRNRALIGVGYRGGLRISEALALYPKDVDTSKGEIRILHGKGDRARTVGLDEQACALVDLWLKRRKELGLNARHRLFCTITEGKHGRTGKMLKKGAPLTDAYVRALMPRIAARAGLEKRFHFHGLRHSYAKELVEEGVTMPLIQRTLGHSSLATTQKYLQSIAPQEVIDAVRTREWKLE